jgi:gluconolactonase
MNSSAWVVVVAAALGLAGCTAKSVSPAAVESDREPEPVAVIAGTEGPAVDSDGFVYFTEIVSQRILLLSPNGIVSIYRGDSNGANGMVIDPEGRLVVCEASDRRRRQARVTRTNLTDGKVEVLTDNYRGAPYSAPNDITLDGRGRLYFTDAGPVGQIDGAVYRIDADGSVTRLLAAPAVERPNGLAISPGDKTLYLVESNRVPELDRRSRPARMIRAYDLSPEGTLSNMRVFHNFYPGRSADGLCIDTAGNVYAAAGLSQLRATDETLATKTGIYVFSPAGRLLEFMPIPEDLITNCAFGGPGDRTLYVTAGKTLYKLPVAVPGMRTR